jgi:hypothetical protein
MSRRRDGRRLHQRGRRSEDRLLLDRELGERRLLLSPLEIGIAAQRAEPRARSVDEHAIDLAGEALDLRVALVRDQLRVHVREAGAREPRLQVREPAVVRVERVEPALRSHQSAQQQRLAARAGAEIDDHFRALRRDQVSDELAPFVLHFERAGNEQRMPCERRPPGDAQAQRRIGSRLRIDARRLRAPRAPRRAWSSAD